VADAMVFDFETGTSSPRGPLEPPPAECTPVQSEWLDALGLVATLRPPPLPAIPADPSNFGRRCNQVLVLTRNGQPFAVHPFEGFCSGEAKLVAYPLPALKRTLFKLVVDGVAGDLFAVATPHARRSDRVLPTQAVNWLLLPSPWANAAQARNDAGMTLYRQERFDEAVAYFESAFQHSLGEGPALFLALFNQAATLARVGRKEGSLAVLRQLLSYSAHRARFVKKVRADQDFTSLREDPRLEALLTEVNCCLDGTLSERVKEVVRWTNGESVTVERVEVLAGVKQAEFNAVKGVDRTWYPSGQLSREAVLLHGEKSGVARRWYASGKLRLETTWRDGVKNGRERSWSDTGQLLSESSFVDGVRRGRQREWYPSGQLKSEFNDVKGVPTGQWWPEDAGTLGPSP
jgi:tetratricopeptide (TPR) repeat protein